MLKLLIKSGRYIDIFYAKTCDNNKNKHSGGVSCSIFNAFILLYLTSPAFYYISAGLARSFFTRRCFQDDDMAHLLTVCLSP